MAASNKPKQMDSFCMTRHQRPDTLDSPQEEIKSYYCCFEELRRRGRELIILGDCNEEDKRRETNAIPTLGNGS